MGSSRNPTGRALLKGNAIKTTLGYAVSEILEKIVSPRTYGHRRPLKPSKDDCTFRNTDREMISKGYRGFPQNLLL